MHVKNHKGLFLVCMECSMNGMDCSKESMLRRKKKLKNANKTEKKNAETGKVQGELDCIKKSPERKRNEPKRKGRRDHNKIITKEEPHINNAQEEHAPAPTLGHTLPGPVA